MRIEGKHLLDKWKGFRKELAVEDDFETRQLSVSEVISIAQNVSKTWTDKRKQGKYSALKRYFHKACEGLSGHETMLQVLPAGNEYVSLFTGTLATIIKASVNHERTAAGLSKSLEEITDCVGECLGVQSLFNTKEAQRLIADLYGHIFLFLEDAMGWYLRKHHRRILGSFRENLYDSFAEQIATIKEFARKIKHQGHLGGWAEGRVIRLELQRVSAELADLRLGAQGATRVTADLTEAAKQVTREATLEGAQKHALMLEGMERLKSLAVYIYQQTTEGLEARATERLVDEISDTRLTSARMLQASEGAPLLAITESDVQAIAGREEFLLASRDLELHFDRNQMRLSFEIPANVTITSQIANRLRCFVTNVEDTLLAVAGPTRRDHQGLSTTSKVAASLVEQGDTIGIPIISWFCALASDLDEDDGTTKEARALISLVYALIRQLIELLPLKPQAPVQMEIGAFESLDGTLSTIDAALQLLETAIEQMDSMLLIVIDGFQCLDDASTSHYLDKMVEILMAAGPESAQSSRQGQPLVRVLMTTSGRSRALLRMLDRNAYVLADESGPRPGGVSSKSVFW